MIVFVLKWPIDLIMLINIHGIYNLKWYTYNYIHKSQLTAGWSFIVFRYLSRGEG